MTKLKNTKKGMAKKALSISLVAAMLATSNVPVWAAEFSDGTDVAAFTSDVESPVVEAEEPVVETPDTVTAAVEETEEPALTAAGIVTEKDLDFSNVKISADDEGKISVSGSILKKNDNNQPLQNFEWRLERVSTKQVVASGSVTGGTINISAIANETGDINFIVKRNDTSAVFEAVAATVSVFLWNDFAPNNTKKVAFNWNYKGHEVESGGISYDKDVLNLDIVLPRALTDGEEATVTLQGKDTNGNITPLNGVIAITKPTIGKGENTLRASYQLSEDDIGKGIYAFVVIGKNKDENGNYGKRHVQESNVVRVTKSHQVLSGKPSIKIVGGGAEIRPGVVLKADISDVKPSSADLHYRWQKWNAKTNKWEAVQPEATDPWHTDVNYIVGTADYNQQIRVAVFEGEFYEADKAVFSDPVIVKAATLDEEAVTVDSNLPGNDKNYDINLLDEKVWGTKTFNALDFDANRLDSATEFVVRYNGQTLTTGEDYTVEYKGTNQIGKVTVTITILPTRKTEYSSGTKVYKDAYELIAPTQTAPGFKISSAQTSSEYNGKEITPSVTITNPSGQVLDAGQYKVYSVGPDTGTYTVNAYVNGQGMADNKVNGVERKITITAKNINNHASDFELNIPDAVWEASEASVEANTVSGAKITLVDRAVSVTKDLLAKDSGESWEIQALNWEDGGVKKQIKITFTDKYGGNYKGTITKEGTATTRSITQFQTQFWNAIRTEAGYLTYNGRLQDVLGNILSGNTHNTPQGNGNTGCIILKDAYNLNEYKLYVGRDFDYKIVKGGTNAGDVSVYIEGKGNYSGSMTLENVYSIAKANFRNDVNPTGKVKLSITYDPALGDFGGKADAYVESAKKLLSLTMKNGGYKLTLDKDYWLDVVSNVTASDEIWYRPTVRENVGEGHGENPNFLTDDKAYADKDIVTVNLVRKALNSSDIKVTVTRSEYNNGNLVTPQVRVAYVKDGKEYVISPDYYDVKIIKSAYDKGQTGKVNIVAKTNLDRSKYPQLYSGNQMVDYTVGATNLALGSIVAENGLATLPSVAYNASQAASEEGITLETGKYLVKDASGNVVDPKYYTVSYKNNKAIGTATIIVTGKGEYEGTVSADFTITKNNLPSGTITLMENMLEKTYTGEGVELTAGTDYTITGELGKLKEGTDYMISYENNINVTTTANKAVIKLVGINNYAGEVVAHFDIKPAKISAADITVGEAVYLGGADVQPVVTITIPGGKTVLEAGKDYTVSYKGHAINAGDKGTVEIAYKENKNINTADSAKTAEFTVAAKDLKDVVISTIADQEVTGSQIKPEVTVMNGSVKMEAGKDYQVSYGENLEIGVGTVTVKPAEGNNNYTGSQEVSFKIVEATPEVGRATIDKVVVKGNVVTPVLTSEADGAVGYDFVISTVEDTTSGRVDVSKNNLKAHGNFYYVQPGTYYAYCHAWKRGEDGKKVFGEWSNIYKFEVKAITPTTPTITSVKRKGSTVTVEFTGSSNAIGYDVILGAQYKKVNGEKRPVNYGELVQKGVKKNTVVFENVPAGTYYVGLHAFNRTSEDGKKVFSKWSNTKKVTVK